jgi:hypothetical protein
MIEEKKIKEILIPFTLFFFLFVKSSQFFVTINFHFYLFFLFIDLVNIEIDQLQDLKAGY